MKRNQMLLLAAAVGLVGWLAWKKQRDAAASAAQYAEVKTAFDQFIPLAWNEPLPDQGTGAMSFFSTSPTYNLLPLADMTWNQMAVS